ncbi:MAG: hypothetical protein KAR65_07020 [Anaerolineales bacterium]|nr:hypothetical protein [Anaerolineales bacterium]
MRHIWSVPCSHAVIDKDSNNVSLLNIIEQIRIPEAPREDTFLPIPLDVMTLWARENPNVPVTGNSRIKFVSPTGNILGAFEAVIDLSTHERLRAKLTFQGLKLIDSGNYKFLVEQKSEGATRWKKVAEIPLRVMFSEPSEESD